MKLRALTSLFLGAAILGAVVYWPRQESCPCGRNPVTGIGFNEAPSSFTYNKTTDVLSVGSVATYGAIASPVERVMEWCRRHEAEMGFVLGFLICAAIVLVVRAR